MRSIPAGLALSLVVLAAFDAESRAQSPDVSTAMRNTRAEGNRALHLVLHWFERRRAGRGVMP